MVGMAVRREIYGQVGGGGEGYFSPARLSNPFMPFQYRTSIHRIINALQARERARGTYPAPSLTIEDVEHIVSVRFDGCSALSGNVLFVDDTTLDRRDMSIPFDMVANVTVLSRRELRRRARLFRDYHTNDAHRRAFDEMQRFIDQAS